MVVVRGEKGAKDSHKEQERKGGSGTGEGVRDP